VTVQHELPALSTEWLRGGPALALPARELARLSVHSDTRRISFAGLDAAGDDRAGKRLALGDRIAIVDVAAVRSHRRARWARATRIR